MSTRARILTTIGAAWLVAVGIATLVVATNPNHRTDPARPVSTDPNQPIHLRETHDVFAWGTWWMVAGAVTVIAGVAVAIALVWTSRRD